MQKLFENRECRSFYSNSANEYGDPWLKIHCRQLIFRFLTSCPFQSLQLWIYMTQAFWIKNEDIHRSCDKLEKYFLSELDRRCIKYVQHGRLFIYEASMYVVSPMSIVVYYVLWHSHYCLKSKFARDVKIEKKNLYSRNWKRDNTDEQHFLCFSSRHAAMKDSADTLLTKLWVCKSIQNCIILKIFIFPYILKVCIILKLFNKSSFSHYFFFNYYSINYLSWTLCFVNFFICTISYLVSLIFNIICSYFAYLLIQKWIHCHFSASARYISHATSIQVPTPLSDLSSFSTGRGKNF